jgi:hypothetical protein
MQWEHTQKERRQLQLKERKKREAELRQLTILPLASVSSCVKL